VWSKHKKINTSFPIEVILNTLWGLSPLDQTMCPFWSGMRSEITEFEKLRMTRYLVSPSWKVNSGSSGDTLVRLQLGIVESWVRIIANVVITKRFMHAVPYATANFVISLMHDCAEFFIVYCKFFFLNTSFTIKKALGNFFPWFFDNDNGQFLDYWDLPQKRLAQSHNWDIFDA